MVLRGQTSSERLFRFLLPSVRRTHAEKARRFVCCCHVPYCTQNGTKRSAFVPNFTAAPVGNPKIQLVLWATPQNTACHVGDRAKFTPGPVGYHAHMHYIYNYIDRFQLMHNAHSKSCITTLQSTEVSIIISMYTPGI